MRILGLDYGSKTVGAAISDPLGITAQGVETIWRKQENHLRQTLARIEELVSEYHVEKIVLGYPKNMNNTIGERAQKSLEFKEMLERRTGLEVIMWDERLTTVEANRTLMEASVRRENRKQYLDQLAAVFILQGYLDSLSCQEINKTEKIKFQLEDGTEAEFYVEEQTRIGGVAYLLVSDSQDDEATAYIFKDVSEDDSQEACYEMVEDEDEMQAVFKVFEQMLDDVDLEMQHGGVVLE